MPSEICLPIGISGSSEVIESWKTIAIRRPRTSRRSLRLAFTSETPPSEISPSTMRPFRGSSPSSASAIAVFPEPDSPTMPTASPASISNDTSRTATIRPYDVPYTVERCCTTSAAGSPASGIVADAISVTCSSAPWSFGRLCDGSSEASELHLDGALECRVECVAQAVTDE